MFLTTRNEFLTVGISNRIPNEKGIKVFIKVCRVTGGSIDGTVVIDEENRIVTPDSVELASSELANIVVDKEELDAAIRELPVGDFDPLIMWIFVGYEGGTLVSISNLPVTMQAGEKEKEVEIVDEKENVDEKDGNDNESDGGKGDEPEEEIPAEKGQEEEGDADAPEEEPEDNEDKKEPEEEVLRK